MDDSVIKRKVFDFLSKNELGIISTIHSDKNAPESAVIGFGNNESLELIFGTSIRQESTKIYKKIKMYHL